MRRLPAFALLLPALLGLSAFDAQAARLDAMKVVQDDAGTHAVLDLAGAVDYKVFTLANPDRLVLDLAGTSLGAAYRAPAPNGVVAGVRTGKPAEGDLRVVLDLARAV